MPIIAKIQDTRVSHFYIKLNRTERFLIGKLTNAFKHAFVNRKEGKIGVVLRASEEGVVSRTVSDDGVGLPEGFNNKGTSFKIKFKMAKA